MEPSYDNHHVMTIRYAALTAVFLAGLIGRGIYEGLKKRGRVDPARRLVFALVFIDMALMWASWFGMSELDPVPLSLPSALRWSGLCLTVLGAALFLGALVQLRALENTKTLVTGGLFAVTRHPIYLGFVLWFLGWPIFHGAGMSLCLGMAGIAATISWRKNEERALQVQFGDRYREYQARTWF